jgi:hypothetical protein
MSSGIIPFRPAPGDTLSCKHCRTGYRQVATVDTLFESAAETIGWRKAALKYNGAIIFVEYAIVFPKPSMSDII